MSLSLPPRLTVLGIACLALLLGLFSISYIYPPFHLGSSVVPAPASVESELDWEPEPIQIAQAGIEETDRKAKFEEIYSSNEWGSAESHSGVGSTLALHWRVLSMSLLDSS